MKIAVKTSAAVALVLGSVGVLIVYAAAQATTTAMPLSRQPVALGAPASEMVHSTPVMASIAAATPSAGSAGVLDERRQFALGMIETGNHDGEIGGAGEVSRYQIMPAVWRHYSDSQNYHDPGVSLAVAQQHWAALYSTFKRQARREPTDFDMYVLWNTHSGYYSGRNFDPARIGPVVRDRAQRYVNLVEYGQNS